MSSFIPIPELFSDDGDLHLIFLEGNGLFFYEKVTDPWYRATRLGPSIFAHNNLSQNVYIPEEPASPLACVERYQFCNAGKECSPLSGTINALVESASLFNMTPFDVINSTVPEDPIGSRFYWYNSVLSTMATDVYVILQNLGPKALLSQQSLLSGVMGPLPDDQWQLDVTYWWAIRLASIQAAFVNTVHDTGNAALDEFRVRPYNSYMQDMCNNQVRIKIIQYTYGRSANTNMKTKTNCITICRKSKAPTTRRSASLDYTSPT